MFPSHTRFAPICISSKLRIRGRVSSLLYPCTGDRRWTIQSSTTDLSLNRQAEVTRFGCIYKCGSQYIGCCICWSETFATPSFNETPVQVIHKECSDMFSYGSAVMMLLSFCLYIFVSITSITIKHYLEVVDSIDDNRRVVGVARHPCLLSFFLLSCTCDIFDEGATHTKTQGPIPLF